ncbi:hypothetical protein D5086_005795 [Populus alba]|uniref:Uncharacterized protein n=1 Tax=Populus alba TaxID=43335 RepID=A0ACC4CU95_POPAL
MLELARNVDDNPSSGMLSGKLLSIASNDMDGFKRTKRRLQATITIPRRKTAPSFQCSEEQLFITVEQEIEQYKEMKAKPPSSEMQCFNLSNVAPKLRRNLQQISNL